MWFKRKHLQWAGIACLVLGLVVSVFLGVSRWQVEQKYRTVEILLDYDQLRTLAEKENLSLQTIASQFRQAGATGVVVRERTLGDFVASGDLLVLRGFEIALQQSLNPGLFLGLTPVPQDTYLFASEPELLTEMHRELSRKKEHVEVVQVGGQALLALSLSESERAKLGVGFPLTDLQEIAHGGLTIVPRLRSWERVSQNSVDELMVSLHDLPELSMLTFNDAGILGDVGYLAEKFKDLQVPVGSFEFFSQRGLGDLAFLLEKNMVRIHCIGENELTKYNESSALERFNLAVAERNIRALYVRLFDLEQSATPLEQGLSFISRVKVNVEAQGMVVGLAQDMQSIPYARLLVFWVGLAVLGGGILCLNYFLAPQWTVFCAGGGLLVWVSLLYLQPLGARKLFALLAALIFPVLAIMTLVRKKERTLKEAVVALLLMTGISFLGAILLTGLLADKSFLLQLEQFRGVKLAHLVPLLILPLYFFLKYTEQKPRISLSKVFQAPLTVGYTILGVSFVLVLVIYLLRTGNGGHELISSAEVKFREMLNTLLVVRPRTKEFLIGHPLMLWLLFSGYSHRKIPLLVLGAIGQISVINTYAHLHTPLAVSFLRTFHGLWLGVFSGLLLLLVIRFIFVPIIRRFIDG